MSWLMTDSVRSMSKDAFWGGSLLTDDELIGSLHEIGAFSLEELATLIDELEGILLKALEFACASLELERASLDDEFSLAWLGGFTGNSLFALSQQIQKNDALERNSLPRIQRTFVSMIKSPKATLERRIRRLFC